MFLKLINNKETVMSNNILFSHILANPRRYQSQLKLLYNELVLMNDYKINQAVQIDESQIITLDKEIFKKIHVKKGIKRIKFEIISNTLPQNDDAIDSMTEAVLCKENESVLVKPKIRMLRRFNNLALNLKHAISTINDFAYRKKLYPGKYQKGFDFLRSEMPPGQLLENIISNRRNVSLEQKTAIIIALLDEIARCHSMNIRILNLQPANIFYDAESNKITFTNFLYAQDVTKKLTKRPSKPWLQAPEIKDEPQEQADLYTAGLIISLLMNITPYDIQTLRETDNFVAELVIKLIRSNAVYDTYARNIDLYALFNSEEEDSIEEDDSDLDDVTADDIITNAKITTHQKSLTEITIGIVKKLIQPDPVARIPAEEASFLLKREFETYQQLLGTEYKNNNDEYSENKIGFFDPEFVGDKKEILLEIERNLTWVNTAGLNEIDPSNAPEDSSSRQINMNDANKSNKDAIELNNAIDSKKSKLQSNLMAASSTYSIAEVDAKLGFFTSSKKARKFNTEQVTLLAKINEMLAMSWEKASRIKKLKWPPGSIRTLRKEMRTTDADVEQRLDWLKKYCSKKTDMSKGWRVYVRGRHDITDEFLTAISKINADNHLAVLKELNEIEHKFKQTFDAPVNVAHM